MDFPDISPFELYQNIFYIDNLASYVADTINIILLRKYHIYCAKWRNSFPFSLPSLVLRIILSFFFSSLKQIKSKKLSLDFARILLPLLHLCKI